MAKIFSRLYFNESFSIDDFLITMLKKQIFTLHFPSTIIKKEIQAELSKEYIGKDREALAEHLEKLKLINRFFDALPHETVEFEQLLKRVPLKVFELIPESIHEKDMEKYRLSVEPLTERIKNNPDDEEAKHLYAVMSSQNLVQYNQKNLEYVMSLSAEQKEQKFEEFKKIRLERLKIELENKLIVANRYNLIKKAVENWNAIGCESVKELALSTIKEEDKTSEEIKKMQQELNGLQSGTITSEQFFADCIKDINDSIEYHKKSALKFKEEFETRFGRKPQ